MTTPTLTVLSLGAGVQSTTLLLMALDGELVRPDCAIFADTGWEPKAVYAHLDWLDKRAQREGFPIHRVSVGNIRDDALASLHGRRFATMPFHTTSASAGGGMLRRQCTREYKVTPITRKIRALAGLKKGERAKGKVLVEQWHGISLDEAHRMRQNREPWITTRYPLIDLRMRRGECVAWLERHGYPIPQKSACIACPYHDNKTWRAMKDYRPEEWAEAVAFDEAIRTGLKGFTETLYVHQTLVPLSEVDLSTPEDHGQLNMFGNECEGLCGV